MAMTARAVGRDSHRRVWAEVDLAAVRHNTSVMALRAAPGRVCAVVKANGYGHGMAAVSGAAVEGGASSLAVACIEEGAQLRDAGRREPVLVLSEPHPDSMADVVGLDLVPTIYTPEGLAAAASAAARAGRRRPLPVHLKVDTGMRRVGTTVGGAVDLALAARDLPGVTVEGLWTHLAVADEPGNPFTGEQTRRFRSVVASLVTMGLRPPVLHVSNSAGVLSGVTGADGGDDLVRCGISLYGVPPSPALDGAADLRPALSLRARVSYVKDVGAGEAVSYGLRYRCDGLSRIATVPVGYADGVPWRLGNGDGEVLIGGRRRPIAGRVTMDQILVDCGSDRTVVAGDEVVLLGSQGGHTIGAWDWASLAGTIAYEILCGIGPRVEKVYR